MSGSGSVGHARRRPRLGNVARTAAGVVRPDPEAQRGVGEGQRPWDLTPDSVMTNATVGTITQAPSGQVLHVTFKGGESELIVRPECPVLGNADGDTSLEETRRHRDLRPALCRKGRHQAADVMVAPLYQLERH
jgi:hypothetical protein